MRLRKYSPCRSIIKHKNKNSASKASLRRQDIISKPIGQQLVKLTIPMLYALISIMGLGLVDSYFISYLGTEQLAAIGFIVPITSIVTSIGLGLGMAISSLVSKLIGAGQLSSAARLITNGFYLTAAVSLITVIILIWQMDVIFKSIGANDETLAFISQYMSIWIFAAPLTMLTMVSSSTFRSLGDTGTSARIALSMTIVNVIFDPLLIFGIGPFPELGMHGAALATLLAVVTSCLMGFYELAIKEKFLLTILPKWQELKVSIMQLLDIAIPAILANAIVPITAAVLTTLVAKFGVDAVAGYGVGIRLEAVSLMIVYALSSTLPMFIGQNLGAKKLDRVHQAIKIAFRFVLMLQLAIYVLLFFSTSLIAGLFSSEQSVIETITLYLWIVPISYGLSGVVILVNVSMNVLGKPRLALYINIVRLAVFYFPLAYLGAHYFGLKGLFIGIAVGNCCAYLIAVVLLNKTMQKMNIEEHEHLST
ncbi:MAG: putative MATE family efflux protein [Arenicella sp.]|jgi:putative MATE family efflux protein